MRDSHAAKLVKQLIDSGYTVTREGDRWKVRYRDALVWTLSDAPSRARASANARASVVRVIRERRLPPLTGN